jgi:transposase
LGAKWNVLVYAFDVELKEDVKAPVKTIVVDRSQVQWAALDLEGLIDEQHPARMIWELSGRFDLRLFEDKQKSREGDAGRPCWPARLQVSIWIYGYTLGVASARALERMMPYEPGLRWLTADQQINHHTLSDFRVGHKEALEGVFAQLLTLLETAGLVDLKRLLHDGTKVRAVAGRGSLHRRKTVEKRMRQARHVIKKLDEKAAAEGEGMDARRQAAQQRAAREALARATAALEKLKKLEAAARPSERDQVRVSDSEPEARNMKHADGGCGPSYNVQVTTEAKGPFIVGMGVCTAANDTQELMPAVARVKSSCGAIPEQMIADGGYATRSNVEQTSAQKIELIAPWKEAASREAGACKSNGIEAEFAPSEFRNQRGGKKLTCPAGKTLVQIQQKTHHGVLRNVFEARAQDCRRCQWKKACCGSRGGPRRVERVVESPPMKQYLARMKRPEVRQLYRKRSEIAEFPHMWMKAVKKWRRFSVRGLVKAGIEATWVALSYNAAQMMRLQRTLAAAA